MAVSSASSGAKRSLLELKLSQATDHWKRTSGEYVIRIFGILFSLGLLILTWHLVSDSFSFHTSKVFNVPAVTYTPKLKSLLMVTSDLTGIRGGQEEALRESIEGYFGAKIHQSTLRLYRSEQLYDVDGVVVFNNAPIREKDRLDMLVSDVVDRSLPVIWVGTGISAYRDLFALPKSTATTLRQLPENSKLHYRGININVSGMLIDTAVKKKNIPPEYLIANVTTPDGEQIPAIIFADNLLYIPLIPFEDLTSDLALAAAVGSMSRLMGKKPKDPRVLFRLEDIEGYTYGPSDVSFNKTTDVLIKENVYVHLGLIPVYMNRNAKNPTDIGNATNVLTFISEHPEQVEAIQHGTQHFRIDPRNTAMGTGEAWEFFFDDDIKYGPDWAREFALNRIQQGYDILLSRGIQPASFEAPHYEMSFEQQKAVGHIYTIMHHPQLFHGKIRSGITSSWITLRDGVYFVPGSAGYVAANDPDNNVQKIIDRLSDLAQILPDPMAVVFYHPFMTMREGGEDELTRLIEGIRNAGYRFGSTRFEVSRLTPDD